jgi:type VI secretion system secreted protein VgrG
MFSARPSFSDAPSAWMTLATPAIWAHDALEIYEWPGGYTEYGDGEDYIRVRLKESLTGQSRVRGQSCHRALATGYTFNLYNYPRGDQNQQYLITGLSYHLKENPRVSAVSPVSAVSAVSPVGAVAPGAKGSATEEGSFQRYELHAQPTRLAYTPARSTPRPRTTGPQTAVVVGPAGEEIWTDEYGRIKVQFHWDRLGRKDQNSSCWIRVATSWAGTGFGAISIPRIGHEVVVDFLNGDPDYPIVTGCVYNAAHMPPWALPANATQSGIKTRSSKDGAPGAGLKHGRGDANAIRFEDKAGAEQLWLHAQKDQLTEVENDEDKWVGNDRRKTVDRDETNVIHRDRTETVDRNEDITVHNNRTERVDHDEKISIGDNRSEDVGRNESIHIGKNRRIRIGASKSETIALAYTQSTGIAKMMNIGLGYSRNVGMAMNSFVGVLKASQVGVAQKLAVGQAYSINVGKYMDVSVGVRKTVQAGQICIHSSGEYMQLLCGKASIVLQRGGGIYLKGVHIDLQGESSINADAGVIQWNCGASQSAPAAPQAGSGSGSSGDSSGASGGAGASPLPMPIGIHGAIQG